MTTVMMAMMTMARGKQSWLGLIILLATSATAFVGHHKSTTTHQRVTTIPLRLRWTTPTLSSKKIPYKYSRLHVQPSPIDDDELLLESDSSNNNNNNNNNNDEATTPILLSESKYDDGDPRQALEQFGSLFSQVQAIITEGSTWDNDKLDEKTQEFVRTYIKVVVPGIGYAATSIAVYASSFLFLELVLAVSGRGYTDITAAVSGIGFLRDLLEQVDPSWGNTAIALLGCEALAPVILAATLALTPKTMEIVRNQMEEWGWGEDDIDQRVSEIRGN
jgi:hypothetical protein